MADTPPTLEIDQTDVGSYFVANYPPFSVWTAAAAATDGIAALESQPADVPLGLYLHIPFCRKRCHFCYFRVYTDKNAREVEQYLDLLAREWELYQQKPAIAGRRLDFVYLGGARRRSCRRASCSHSSEGSRKRRRGPMPRKSRSSASRAR